MAQETIKTVGPTLVWFRNDLRIGDNPALAEAVARGGPVLPVFVWSPAEDAEWRAGTASRWWLRRSLERLDEDLRKRGSSLIVLRGPTIPALDRLCQKTRARRVLWGRCYAPSAIALERRLTAHCTDENFETVRFETTLLSTSRIETGSGNPFQKFTPFYKKFLAEASIESPGASGRKIPSIGQKLSSETPQILEEIEPRPPGPQWNLDAVWQPGSAGAQKRLEAFLRDHVDAYPQQHDRMDDLSGTSRLSPHLSFGEISGRQVWQSLEACGKTPGIQAFKRQLVWREFAYHQLIEFPGIVDRPLRREFEALPTSRDEALFEAWQEGRTGYPVVDAGMRELASTGWMHNRARMVVASFLIKHLALPWQWGAHWFWDKLVDADLANNSLNWQWVAGSAADASPYYRIFNPTRQGERFDPEGHYVRRWVPELRSINGSRVHGPTDDGESLGVGYPDPIIGHQSARESALKRYALVQERRRELRA